MIGFATGCNSPASPSSICILFIRFTKLALTPARTACGAHVCYVAYPSASASSSRALTPKARMLAMRSELPVSKVMTLEKLGPVTAMQV